MNEKLLELARANKLIPVFHANPQDIIDYKNVSEVTEDKTKINSVPLYTQDQFLKLAELVASTVPDDVARTEPVGEYLNGDIILYKEDDFGNSIEFNNGDKVRKC